MNDPIFNVSEFFLGFLFLSALYVGPVGFSFLLMKFIANKSLHSPYTLRHFALLCIPGALYGFLESASSRQGLNFLLVLPSLALFGIVAVILIRRIKLNVFVLVASTLAIVLWLTVPKAVLRLM